MKLSIYRLRLTYKVKTLRDADYKPTHLAICRDKRHIHHIVCTNRQHCCQLPSRLDEPYACRSRCQASPVIHKSDRDLFIPSAEAVKQSNNGLSLLQNIQIPTLVVNTVLESVSNPSGDVQLRINGREASINEVKALLPESIVRVEYHENPGLRYNDANAVLDFIVRNPTVGGSVMADAMYWMQAKRRAT